MAAAARFGRFSVVTVLDRQAPMFRALAMRHGLGDTLTSVHGIGVPVLALEEDRASSIDKTIPACRDAMSGHGAEAIAFGCTGMLGFAGPVAKVLGCPPERIIDPLPNAVRAAVAAIEQGAARFPAPERKRIRGFEAWEALNAAMSPKDNQ